MPPDNPAQPAVSFGPFRLVPTARLLERDGAAVHIGGRALDILIVLAERAGEVVSKRDLATRVWSGVTVDEGSLRFHVAALRKALGDGRAGARYVTNVAGRGYCLVVPVMRSDASFDAVEPAAAPALVSAPPPARAQTLPARLTRMVGRDDTVQKLAQELATHRLVTVVGAGGIGKTTVASAVGYALSSRFDLVAFVDLGPVGDARLVPAAVASALGLVVSSDDPVPGLIAFLQDRRVLLIFDSCEHVIETATTLAETIVTAARSTHLLATSRESLRADGEHVHRLFPLGCPPPDSGLSAADVRAFPAVQLFVDRVTASAGDFELTDANAAVVSEICQRLDGIALALELAAGRVAAYGVQGIARLLDTRLGLSWQGRRTAMPRHQTLRATLDWSYDLLDPLERSILCRLAVIVGPFTMEAAMAIAAVDPGSEATLAESFAGLVAKSLVAVDTSRRSARYRLLDTTRVYLLGKLTESGEADQVAKRHAQHFAALLHGTDHSVAEHSAHVGNVRAALDWSFSAHGDRAIAIELAAAAAKFFLELSLLTECLQWSERAIAACTSDAPGDCHEMELQAAFGLAVMFTRGNREEARIALERSIALAEALGDRHTELRLLRGLHIFKTRIGDFQAALEIGHRSAALAAGLNDPPGAMMADWMIGVAHHLIGNQADAMARCASSMMRSGEATPGELARIGYDHRLVALVAYARALWLCGHPDRAVRAADHAIADAEAIEQPLTLCITLIWAVYVFLWTGNWVRAEAIIERLIGHAAKHSLGPYQAVGLGLKGELALGRGQPAAGVELLSAGVETLRASQHNILSAVFAAALADGLATLGEHEAALVSVDGAIAQVEGGGGAFGLPEMLRIKGRILAAGPGDAAEAEVWLTRSLDAARRQSALGWELRAASSLAALWQGQGRSAEARALLGPIHGRFSEGLETPDLRAARDLLDRLGAV